MVDGEKSEPANVDLMESTANNAMIGEVKVMFCHNTTRQETSV